MALDFSVVWRFRELLPFCDDRHCVTIGEGQTILQCNDGVGRYVNSDAGRVYLPIEKCLLYRTTSVRGPEGRSMLRNAYRSWFFKKRAEEYLMISMSRDATGMPVAKVPAEVLLDKGAEYEALRSIVTGLMRDEQEGVLWPGDRDPTTGEPMYELELLGSPGAARVDGIAVIRMLAADMAGTLLADFLQLGRDAVGSRALAEPKQALFQAGLEFLADQIADVLNRFGVPRLMAMNGYNLERLPGFRHSPISDIDLADLGAFVRDTAQAGIPWVTGDDMQDTGTINRLRSRAGFEPVEPMDETVKGLRVRLRKGMWVPS